MENQVYKYLCLFLILVTTATEAYAYNKLYVFGDSYVDTGNRDYKAISWHAPYGMTYPGKPAGRFSDGHVFSDYIAKGMCMDGFPVPYRFIKQQSIAHGINFAIGGSGVLATNEIPQGSMKAQIDQFQQLIEKNIITKDDLSLSVALVSVSGTDYADHLHKGEKIPVEFIEEVVNQIGADLKRIRELGVAKIAVMGLHPVECLPYFTKDSGFKGCEEKISYLSERHNRLLGYWIEDLNEDNESRFVMLDMYGAFKYGMNQKDPRFSSPVLKPCCKGTNNACSEVINGVTYTAACSNPKVSFYWDAAHLTDSGWRAVYNVVKSANPGLFEPCP